MEARITDGRRIAELLASELDGRTDGGLDRVSLTDLREDAAGTSDGTLAYRVLADGEPVAAVSAYPDRVAIAFVAATAGVADAARSAGLPAVDEGAGVSVSIESGAAVKRAVPVVQAALAGR